jgi:cell division protein FtsB
MEAHEAAEQIQATAEGAKAEHERETRFRNRVAILIAVMAALLAVSAILGQKATEHEINANVDAADVRSTHDARMTQLQADQETIQAEQEQLADPSLPPDVRTIVQQHLQADEALAARLESNPAEGDGIKELGAQVQTIEHEQETSSARGDSYDIGETLFQIAIVLASVAILIISFPLVLVSSAVGVAALLLLLNGLVLLVHL